MRKYTTYIKESLYDSIKGKLDNDYSSSKRDLLDLIEKDLGSSELADLEKFIVDYINKDENTIISGLNENNEYYDFYLKHQVDIDDILSKDKFFDKIPSKSSIYSLYDYMVSGTKEAIMKLMLSINDESFTK